MCSVSVRILRVDLSRGKTSVETLDEGTLRKYLGGTCLGARYLYDEVGPATGWSDPENILFLGSGPLGGTGIAGSGGFSVVTKGPMTDGATSTQANGFFGAYLKFSGFDGVIVTGAARDWRYLFVHDGAAELRDAGHLTGKDTFETERLIKRELGHTQRSSSVSGIGPAGENGVRYAAIVGDRGHVAAHNGAGAVMGSKKLKAIAVSRGKGRMDVKDAVLMAAVSREIIERFKNAGGFDVYRWGTSRIYTPGVAAGSLPVRNYTTNLFPDHARFMGDYVRAHFQIRRNPCYACPAHHCHSMKVTEGPYAGFEGEEPEYEQWAAWGSLIGQTDPGAAVVLSNEVDGLGMDTNEAGWVVAWVMECYEKGMLSQRDLDGLDMTWGNVEATRSLLRNIAQRRGFGAVLAEGVMRAAQHVGGEARDFAIHTGKGNSPRGHDHRARWDEMFSTCVSSTGTMENLAPGIPDPADYGLPPKVNTYSPEEVSSAEARTKGSMQFEDSLVTCRFVTRTNLPVLCRALNAATGWDFSFEEALNVGRRAVNLMRVFNIRQGMTSELDWPSARYSSTPTDGPAQGSSVLPHWRQMLRNYYGLMGWDKETGVPLPETLESLGLGDIVADISSWRPQTI